MKGLKDKTYKGVVEVIWFVQLEEEKAKGCPHHSL